jgi:hypothetical protein
LRRALLRAEEAAGKGQPLFAFNLRRLAAALAGLVAATVAAIAIDRRLPYSPRPNYTALVTAAVADLEEYHEPGRAAFRLRSLVEQRPDDYAATLLLAHSLDLAERRREAASVWRRVLEMAEQHRDERIATVARARLRASE